MAQIKMYLLFIAINVVIDFAIPIFFGARIINVLTSNALWIYPLVIILLGLLFGFLIGLFTPKSKQQDAYKWGQIFSSTALLIIILIWSNNNIN